ncbi:MAG: hypothetical protein K2L00_03180 [Muribaculaceae bacterium]|nr:hypothetical protein [Muribaculaceae bacterium]
MEIFPQSVRYSGDIEAGVVATRKYATAQINAATTHGAYFAKPKLFIGGGAAIGWNIEGEFWEKVYPVYGALRKDFTINRRFTTFIDAKAGYAFEGDHTGMCGGGIKYGFYCYPSAGLRFTLNQTYGVYLKVGYTYQSVTSFPDIFLLDRHLYDNKKYNAGGFSATIGFTFR